MINWDIFLHGLKLQNLESCLFPPTFIFGGPSPLDPAIYDMPMSACNLLMPNTLPLMGKIVWH
jgi:hypothetical protein